MRDLEDIEPIIEILYHMFNEERDKVLESIDEALECYNDNPIAQVLLNYAKIYSSDRFDDYEALECINKALKLDNDPESRGEYLHMKSDILRSLEVYNKN